MYFYITLFTEDNAFYVVSSGIPGIVFRFLHLFQLILRIIRGLTGISCIPNMQNEFRIEYFFINYKHFFHLIIYCLFSYHSLQVKLIVFSNFGNFWHMPVKWLWFNHIHVTNAYPQLLVVDCRGHYLCIVFNLWEEALMNFSLWNMNCWIQLCSQQQFTFWINEMLKCN